jgi:predicted amidohydrolase YtcJ
MRTLLYNGKIYRDADRFAEALLVEDTKIRKVGSNIDLLPYILDANVIDLKGRTVLPGFNDSHLHLYGSASFMRAVNLYNSSSIDDIVARSNAFIALHETSQDTLVGRGWNQDFFTDEVRLPNRYDLDRISKDRAIVFPRACGHIVALNSKALHLARIDRTTISPEGGAIDKDDNGDPTGILRENALSLIDSLYPEISVAEMLRRLREVALRANSLGITSVQTNDLYIGDDNSKRLEEAYKLFAEERLLKVYHQVCFDDLELFRKRIEEGFIDTADPYNRYGCLKLFADGSLGARTAAMIKPYADDPATSGIAILSPDTLDTWIQTADNAGIQVAVHAIGDRAIRDVLDAYAKVCQGKNIHRHGIVHCQITDETLLKTFQAQDILAYVQPIFLHYDMHIVENRVGKELSETSYAFETMENLNIHTAYGSDAPVEDFNPFDNLYCAITRKDLNGYPTHGFNPQEKVDLATAIDAYTLGGAYASFEEHHKGRLYEGYAADLVILDLPIFELSPESIREVSVDLTMVDGHIVYEKQRL